MSDYVKGNTYIWQLRPQDISSLETRLGIGSSPLDKDIRMVAARLGSTKFGDDSNITVRKCLEQLKDNTLEQLKEVLHSIKRFDVEKDIEEYIKAIQEKAYNDFEDVKLEVELKNNNSQDPDNRPDQRREEENHTYEVFVYGIGDEKHCANIRKLVSKMRIDGIDAICSLFEENVAICKPMYLDERIRDAKFVILVCNISLYTAFENHQMNRTKFTSETDQELTFIDSIVQNYIYQKGGANKKFIPALLPGSDRDVIPERLKNSTAYKVPSDYGKLRRRLREEEQYAMPALGARQTQSKHILVGYQDAVSDVRSGRPLVKNKRPIWAKRLWKRLRTLHCIQGNVDSSRST